MAISKLWKAEGLFVRPTVDGLANVVAQVQWAIVMVQRDDNGQVLAQSVSHGYTALGQPDGNSFVNLDTLTEAQVIAWAQEVMSDKVKEYEAHTYNTTVGQVDTTLVKMIFDDSGKIVEAPQSETPPG